MCSLRQRLSQTMVMIVGVSLCAPVAFAVEPPTITKFEFNRARQEVNFFFRTNQKKTHWTLSSSTGNTKFSNGDTGSVSGKTPPGFGFGNTFGIKPGNDPVGTCFTLTLKVSNDNGNDEDILYLKVVARLSETDGFVESEPCGIPTVSEWGLIVLTVLLLTGLTIKFGRRRPVAA